MDKWKDELKQAFDAPLPLQKIEFLNKLELPQMTLHSFLISQIGYIRKWSWYVSTLVFAIAVLGLAFFPEAVLWLISGLTPLLSLTIVSESGRSELYNMAELEMSTRFSLRSVTFARLGILGLTNLLLLGILLPIGLWSSTVNPFAAVLYIFTPFLLTTFIGLYIVRKSRGREAMHACVGTSVGISISLFLSHNIIPFIYQEQCLSVWLAAALALLFGNGKQCITIIKQKEDFVWNLS
ncbi:MAG: hypothetical protein E7246_08835 [Lachnoclostridium sp.]|nr:hypothetical protein [Lachnoclostridium sp.]